MRVCITRDQNSDQMIMSSGTWPDQWFTRRSEFLGALNITSQPYEIHPSWWQAFLTDEGDPTSVLRQNHRQRERKRKRTANMLDPFIPPPPLLSRLVEPIASALSLPTLPLHAHEVLIAFTLYHVINRYISPAVSSRLFPNTYANLDRRTKINWDVHSVSLCQSLLINTLALWVIWTDEERRQLDWRGRVWGYTGASGLVQGFAAGYFIWDLTVTARYVGIFGWGMVAHAVSALAVFSFGFVCSIMMLIWRSLPDMCLPASVCQLLWPYLHPLRAIVALFELPLVF